jgi:hypothetical protein
MVTWPDLADEAAGGAIAAVCARGRRQNIYTLNLKTFEAAYVNRGHVNILVLIQMIYDHEDVANAADFWAKTQRDELEEVSGYGKLYVYQNYAHGDGPLEAIYEYDAWSWRSSRRSRARMIRGRRSMGITTSLSEGTKKVWWAM